MINKQRETEMTKRSAENQKKFKEWKKLNKSNDLTINDMWKEEIEKKRTKIGAYFVGPMIMYWKTL
jgi:cellobiose-specific phosphotransferase system component IIB